MKIYFSPTYPKEFDYSIIAMIHYLGYSVVRTPEEPFDFGYMWKDCTYLEVPSELLEIAKQKIVININCTNISKVKVDQVFAEVFGYHSLVNPFHYKGKCIKKPNENGKGGGEIIDCPLNSSNEADDSVYQRYIETNPSGPQLEYRVPIVMGSMPTVFEVYKDNLETLKDGQLKHQMKHSILPKEVSQVFSNREHEQVLAFCHKIGLDIGELDVLRCAETGRVYILDVNKTPTYLSMFHHYWKPADKRKAIAVVSEKWEEQLKTFIIAK